MRKKTNTIASVQIDGVRLGSIIYLGLVLMLVVTAKDLGVVAAASMWIAVGLIGASSLYIVLRGRSWMACAIPAMFAGLVLIGQPMFDMLMWCTIGFAGVALLESRAGMDDNDHGDVRAEINSPSPEDRLSEGPDERE